MKNHVCLTGALMLMASMLLSTTLWAQKATGVKIGSKGMYSEETIFFGSSDIPGFQKGIITIFIDSTKSEKISAGKLLSQETGNNGIVHYKWQQFLHGIPIDRAIYIQHVKGENILSQGGLWVKDSTRLPSAMPRLSKQEAIKNALDFTGAKVYKWEIPAEEALLKEITHDKNATYYPQPSLIYFSGDGEMNIAAMRLAYVLEVYANSPLSKKEIFVDAISGKILGVRQKLYDVDVNANTQTANSGLQQITTDQVSNNLYRLRSANRGNGIVVLNMSGQGMNYGGATDFTNSSTTWSTFNPAIDRYATDAMWGQQKTYDFYKTTFNRNSVDNAGLALYGYVHTNLVAFGFSNNINAFWDGSKIAICEF